MRGLLFALVAVFTLGWSSQASAWGDSGHRIVCEIALRNLTPAARAEVTKLLRANPSIQAASPLNAEFSWACTYPDHPTLDGPGRRSAEHYATFPRSTLSITGPGCGITPTCVISAISADLEILRSPSATDPQRAAALVYVGHWFGDIHQPLHISFDDDLGGNAVNSTGLCTSTLHAAWDNCILQSRALAVGAPLEEVRALAAKWNSQATADQRSEWLKSVPWQWAAESFAAALRPQVGYCVMVSGVCQYSATQMAWARNMPRRSIVIDSAYMDTAMPVIQRRLTQAGIRLAHYLNLVLDPAYHG
jgi:hypothetical protein